MKYCTGIVDKAIQLINQNPHPELLASLGVPLYIKECRTIILSLPRQVGKSTYITNHAGENDIIIYPNYQMRDSHHRKTTVPSFTLDYLYAGTYDSVVANDINMIFWQHMPKKIFDIIWLDELTVEQLESYKLKRVLSILTKTGNEVVVGLHTR